MFRTIPPIRRSFLVLVSVSMVPVPTQLWAQEEPPRPIDELFEEFLLDPGSHTRSLPGTCPPPGSWQRELLERLLTVPTDVGVARALINAQSFNVEHCDIPVLDAWFREALVKPPSLWSVRPVVQALWHSGRGENRDAVLRAISGPELDYRIREAMADQLVGIPPQGLGPIGFLEVLADAYARFGTAVPTSASMLAMRRAGSKDAGLRAKQGLIVAWLGNPEHPGSLAFLSLLMNDAVSDAGLRTEACTPWLMAVGEALERVVDGTLSVSAEVFEYVSSRIDRFRICLKG